MTSAVESSFPRGHSAFSGDSVFPKRPLTVFPSGYSIASKAMEDTQDMHTFFTYECTVYMYILLTRNEGVSMGYASFLFARIWLK